MSETIGEMILPGTYIDVRAEGLIGVSGVSTGNVGIVGTANRGPLNQVVVLGSYSEALWCRAGAMGVGKLAKHESRRMAFDLVGDLPLMR